MNELKKHIATNKDRFLEELFGLIRIPSISSDPAHKEDMRHAARYWKKLLLDAGADKAEIMETKGHPVTYGEKIIDPEKPTVLVYAHMDVMPVDPVELWNTNPFEPVIKDGKIWARGADDDKGQGFMHVKAFEYMVQTNSLPCNVKFMIEGEEEIGSPSLSEFCIKNKEMLKSDVILISDTTMIGPDTPSITTGLRGLAYWQLELTGPDRDLHSGLYGGAVANPINILCRLIEKCTNENNSVAIPGFYDNVTEIPQDEKQMLAKRPFNKELYKKAIGVEKLFGEKGYTTLERTGFRPSFDVCGIWGGFTGEGPKTVLPSKAYAKLSCRLVPGQDHEKIAELMEWYLKSIAPDAVKIKVEYLHGGQAYNCPVDHPAYIAAEKAIAQVFGKKPFPVRSGGSIPIVASFEEILNVKSILMGFGLESDAIHSPNENFPLNNLFKGIETIPYFYKYFAETNFA
ncbi:MAG: dipeptidase [Prolixibacteraceae bacterium]|nr:dipeptidase [Prolixibacteraceae bacterium]